MNSPDTTASSRPIRILLVDPDPTFRVGMQFLLRQAPDLEISAEADSGEAALAELERNIPPSASLPGFDLVVLNVKLGQGQPGQLQGLTLCQHVHQRYPALPILMLGPLNEPILISAAQQAGATGYCDRQSESRRLISLMRRVASGRPYWPSTALGAAERSSGSDSELRPEYGRSLPQAGSFAKARRRLRQSGLAQIDAAIADMTHQLRNLDLSLLERAVLAGRRRELRAARWLVQQMLATPGLPEPTDSTPERPTPRPSLPTPQLAQPSGGALVPVVTQLQTQPTGRDIQTLIFDAVLSKIAEGVQNQTAHPLEIDILRDDKRRELLYTAVRKIEELLSELRYSQVEPSQLADKRSLLLLDAWQGIVNDYFGRYYTLPLDGVEVDVVNTLIQDAAVVQDAILDKIPFVVELFAHLLYQAPVLVNGRPYTAGNPEAIARAELILENLVLQLANATLQPLLNRFGDNESIKQAFYDYRILSTRDIERFRNDLSWKYRMARYFREPKDIFESQYEMLMLYGRNIKTVYVYAPRNQEMETLSGLPYVVTLALETRDAIAPRLRAAVSVVGSGVIYVLTDVVGRAIGLIGRGILKGLGNAWQEGRYNRR